MSKKDYQALATLFGRHLNKLPQPFVEDFLDFLKGDNMRFDRHRFEEWAIDVAEGRRDKFSGKRV